MKNVSLIFILIITIQSCKSQRSKEIDAKILTINKLIEFNYQSNNIRFNDLKKRLTFVDSKKIKSLENSIQKEKIEDEILNSFYNNFTNKEIEVLYNLKESSKAPAPDFFVSNGKKKKTQKKTAISKTLEAKKRKLYDNLYKKDEERYNQFKKEFFKLEALNYKNAVSQNKLDSFKKKNKKAYRKNGIYEVVIEDLDNRYNNENLQLKRELAIDLKHIKSIHKKTTNYSGFNYVIEIIFDAIGTQKTYELTKNTESDQQLAIVVFGEIIIAPFVNKPIENGNIELGGSWNLMEVNQLISSIKSGVIK